MQLMITWQRVLNAAGDVAPWRDRRKIGFMHVPKTSGTALIEAIGRTIRPGRKFYAMDRVLFADFTAFDEFHGPARRMIYPDAAQLPKRTEFLAGHLACSTLQANGRDTLMTLLREPALRVLSHWMFWRNHPDAEIAKLGSWGDRVQIARQPLVAFLSDPSIACQTDNLVTRMLLWPHPLIPEGDFIDAEADTVLIGEALSRLGRFAFVDLVENPAMPSRLQSWLRRPIRLGRSNAALPLDSNRRTSLGAEMTAPARRALAARCRLDAVLWAHIAERRFGPDMAGSLRQRTVATGMQRVARLLAGAAGGTVSRPVPAMMVRPG